MINNYCCDRYADTTTEVLLDEYASSKDVFERRSIGCEIVGRVTERFMAMGMREVMVEVAERSRKSSRGIPCL